MIMDIDHNFKCILTWFGSLFLKDKLTFVLNVLLLFFTSLSPEHTDKSVNFKWVYAAESVNTIAWEVHRIHFIALLHNGSGE